MKNGRRNYPAAFKAKVSLEAERGELTIAEIASKYEIHPNLVSKWKKHLSENISELFSDKRKRKEKRGKNQEDALFREIGKLKVENDFLKKSLGL